MDTQKVTTQYRLSKWAKVIQARQAAGRGKKSNMSANIDYMMENEISAAEKGRISLTLTFSALNCSRHR